jgi:hypothetical protein
VSRRKSDPRIAFIRDAVLHHLEQEDALAVSAILDSIVGWIECTGWQGLPRQATSPIAKAIAMLAAALPEDGIEQVFDEAKRQRTVLEKMQAEWTDDETRAAARAAFGVN